MPVGNFITALDVTPGEDFAVRLSHESWPDPWPDETARFLMLWFAGLMAPVGTIWHFKLSTCGDMELQKLYVNLSKVLHVTVRNKFWFDN